MARVVAVAAHDAPDREPIQLRVGDLVEVEERESDWPAFVFVTSQQGQGWVPARNLSAKNGPALCRRPYDTTELPTATGDVLDVIEEDYIGGWFWCRNEVGKEGWVPMNTVEPIDP